jgi:hypothetical protein
MLSPVTGAWLMLELPGGHHAVHRHALARPHAHDGAQRHLMPPAAVAQLPSACRTEASSGAIASRPLMALRARSTARASIASAMAYSAITIAASGHWPIDERARHGHGHQRIDVQPPVAQRRQALLVDVEAGQPDRRGRHGKARGLPDLRVRGEEAEHLRADGQQQGATEPPRSSDSGAVVMVVRSGFRSSLVERGALLRHRLRIEAGLADRGNGLLDGSKRRVDGHRALPELKGHRANAGDVLDRAPDLRLLAGAVHRRHTEPGPAGRCGDAGGAGAAQAGPWQAPQASAGSLAAAEVAWVWVVLTGAFLGS